MRSIIGWDIGGAHVKAARIENGRVIRVVQTPCPLWPGAERLATVLGDMRDALGKADLHVATMTGELADIFPSRADGVQAIASVLARALSPLRLYGGSSGLLPAEAAGAHVRDIASANWHASAALVARHARDALFVDIGSTTTDIVPIVGAVPAARGYTDAERLGYGELVYTGLTRSFLMALSPRAPMGGSWTPLACEHFATSADVHRVLGALAEDADQMPTADGGAKTIEASRVRLARMVGRDAADATEHEWRGLAAWFAEAQLRLIHDGALLVLSGMELAPMAPVIGAGVGRTIAVQLAARLGRDYVAFADLLGEPASSEWLGDCAPAVAVALLAA
ncbi:MAG TPA: hydantoinase/oxoprolinase family protein [Acetobacteraceae bacterium]